MRRFTKEWARQQVEKRLVGLSNDPDFIHTKMIPTREYAPFKNGSPTKLYFFVREGKVPFEYFGEPSYELHSLFSTLSSGKKLGIYSFSRVIIAEFDRVGVIGLINLDTTLCRAFISEMMPSVGLKKLYYINKPTFQTVLCRFLDICKFRWRSSPRKKNYVFVKATPQFRSSRVPCKPYPMTLDENLDSGGI